MQDKENEIIQLVERYEKALKKGKSIYLSEEELETIAMFYIETMQLIEAVSVCDYAISQYQYEVSFYNQKAEAYRELGHFEKSLETLEQAEVIAPNEESIQLNKADTYVAMEEFDTAIEVLQTLANKQSESEKIDTYFEIADVYEDWEKYEQAIVYLKKIIAIEPENKMALEQMWFAVNLTENYEDSLTFHKKLTEETPYNYIAWNNLGCAYAGLMLYEKAIEAFEFALAVNPKYEKAYVDCMESCFKNENYLKAIDIGIEALQELPPYTQREFYLNVGICYDKLEQHFKAREYFRQAIEHTPNFAPAFYEIARSYLLSEEPQKALPIINKAIEYSAMTSKYKLLKAEILMLLNRIDEAEEIWEKVKKDSKGNAFKHIDLSKMEGLLDEDGIGLFQALIESNFNPAKMAYIHIVNLHAMDKKAEAAYMLNNALEDFPDDYEFLFEMNPELKTEPYIMDIIEDFFSK